MSFASDFEMIRKSRSYLAAISILSIWLVGPSCSEAGLFIDIQPIQVRMDDGTNGAPHGFFEDAGDKIYHQVGSGIDLRFLSVRTLDNTAFLNLETDAEIVNLFTGANHGQNANTLVINMWFVNSISGAYGVGFLGGNGVAIASDVYTFNGGIGRLDTIAHELAHNLGLDHVTDPNNLVASGGVRHVPSSLSEITPDGPGYDQLTPEQIAIILRSPFVISGDGNITTAEPKSIILAAGGVGLMIFWRLRRNRA